MILDRNLEDIEINLLLEGIFQHYGYDFRSFAMGTLRARIRKRMSAEGVRTVSAFQDRVLHDTACLQRCLMALSISATGFFQDVEFYRSFRQIVAPLLRELPFVRFWHAGCASGEEVYSMAILLSEESLMPRCRVYATDVNADLLGMARAGSYSLAHMRENTSNYLKSGGAGCFSDYYTATQDWARFAASLRERTVFAAHDLAVDRPFNEFDVVLCRNVTRYFNDTLRHRVLGVLHESLRVGGYLCLGAEESLEGFDRETHYREVEATRHIFRRES
jgi:chemotaxis protein methyltransferase CheR